MSLRRDFIAALVLLTCAAQGAWAQEKKINLFKVVTVKDEIVIGLSTDELKAAGGRPMPAPLPMRLRKGAI